MLLDIVTPERRLRSLADDTISLPIETQDVVIPGIDGEFEVLPGHSPFITLLGTGVLWFTTKAGKQVRLMVSGGFAEVDRDRVTVMADAAAMAEEVDEGDEKSALVDVERKLQELGATNAEDDDFKKLKVAAEQSAAKLRLK